MKIPFISKVSIWLTTIALAFALGLGGYTAKMIFSAFRTQIPGVPAVVMQVREVARLEVLQVSLYKKITFTPDPTAAETLWGDVYNWVKFSVRSPKGKAIVFAQAKLSFDLKNFGPENVKIQGRTAYVVLPAIKVAIELNPGETEIIGSNLNSHETAQLFEMSKNAFEQEVSADAGLNLRARTASERAIKVLLFSLGFEEVHFVQAMGNNLGA